MANPGNPWYIGMSEDAIRERVVQEAQKWLNVTEGSKRHKEIVDGYNSQKKLPRGYKLQYTDAWCAAFVSFIGICLGISHVILPEVGCGPMIELYKANGRWVEADDYVPKPGDIWMADWDAKKGECTGSPDHVELVEWCDGKNIGLIGGNSDNQVKRRTIPVEYIYTRGFCLPDYASLVQPFKDVPTDAWYSKIVGKAAEMGLMEGVGGGLFEPERPLNRAEAAALAVRIVELIGK